MGKDIKLMLAALGFAILLIFGFAIWQSRSPDSQDNESVEVAGVQITGIEAEPESYDLGDGPINGGLITKEYKVKNTSGDILKLKKIATSCMCTKAKVKVGDKETKLFGMEGHGDKNPPVNVEIPAGELALVTVIFDPAAHGPQGIGPIDRSVFLTFSDPAGTKELRFKGTVTN